MNIKSIFLIQFVCLFCFSLFAQTNKNSREQMIQEQMNEIMKARDEMLKSLLNDSDFGDTGSQNIEKVFEDMIKKFNQDTQGLGQSEIDSGAVIGEYDWRETPTHQIFVLTVKQIKDKPLSIKIEKGFIKLRGDVQSIDANNKNSKKITKVHFERNFSILDGVDQTNPEFENKAGELLIKFKKITAVLPSKKILPAKEPSNRSPLGKDANDLTL